MTVATTSNKVTYNGDGVTTVWGYTFPVALNTDLQIYITDSSGVATLKTLSTDYTVDITNKQVTYPVSGSPLAVGSKITILRSVDLLQTVDWKRQGAFDSEVAEGAIDKLTEQAQQLTEALARSLKLPQSETGSDTNTRLPTVANRASMFLAFDASGNPIAATGASSVPVSAFMTTVLDDLTAVAAQTTLGIYPNLSLGASGTQGSLSLFAPTASKGSLRLKAADSAGNTITDVTIASQAAARTYTIPDAGNNASFVMTEGAQTINGAKTFSNLQGTIGANLAAGGFVLTGLGAGAAAGQSVRFEQLKIIQVVSSTSTSTFSTTSSTFQTSNCSASITPTSASNSIIILATGVLRCANPSVSNGTYASIFRGSTNLGGGTDSSLMSINSQTQLTSSFYSNGTMTYIDQPSTTSATTYAVKIANGDNSTSVSYNIAQKTSIILLEVAP